LEDQAGVLVFGDFHAERLAGPAVVGSVRSIGSRRELHGSEVSKLRRPGGIRGLVNSSAHLPPIWVSNCFCDCFSVEIVAKQRTFLFPFLPRQGISRSNNMAR